jgi:hypothetical protein
VADEQVESFVRVEVVELADRYLRKLYELSGSASPGTRPTPTAVWALVGGRPSPALRAAVQEYLQAQGWAHFEVTLLPAGERRVKEQ